MLTLVRGVPWSLAAWALVPVDESDRDAVRHPVMDAPGALRVGDSF